MWFDPIPEDMNDLVVYLEAIQYLDVSENSGTPKSSILIGFFVINHPFWGTPIFGNTHINDLVVYLEAIYIFLRFWKGSQTWQACWVDHLWIAIITGTTRSAWRQLPSHPFFWPSERIDPKNGESAEQWTLVVKRGSKKGGYGLRDKESLPLTSMVNELFWGYFWNRGLVMKPISVYHGMVPIS